MFTLKIKKEEDAVVLLMDKGRETIHAETDIVIGTSSASRGRLHAHVRTAGRCCSRWIMFSPPMTETKATRMLEKIVAAKYGTYSAHYKRYIETRAPTEAHAFVQRRYAELYRESYAGVPTLVERHSSYNYACNFHSVGIDLTYRGYTLCSAGLGQSDQDMLYDLLLSVERDHAQNKAKSKKR